MIKRGICNTWEIFRWTCYISNRVFRRKIRLIKWRAGGCLCGTYFIFQINYTYIREEHIQRFWFLIIHAEITSWWNKSFILHDIDDIVPHLSGKILLLKFSIADQLFRYEDCYITWILFSNKTWEINQLLISSQNLA